MALETAEQYDPFLKKNVYGNILDQVDNYQYNLKLYMIPPVGKPVGTQPAANQQSGSVDARLDKPTNAKNASGQGGYLQNSLVASPAETIILAQTGVTGTQIDNLEIVSAVNASMGVEISQVNFDIIQPGAADFLDQIVSAKAFLGDQITATGDALGNQAEAGFNATNTNIDDTKAAIIAGQGDMTTLIEQYGGNLDAYATALLDGQAAAQGRGASGHSPPEIPRHGAAHRRDGGPHGHRERADGGRVRRHRAQF